MEDNKNSTWEYNPNGGGVEDSGPAPEAGRSSRPRTGSVTWQAVEFIEHPHNAAWYGGLVLISAALAALVYLITKDYIAAGTIIAAGIIVGVFAKHKPGVVEYEISRSGLKVGAKQYPYGSFKSFSVLQEGNLNSVNFFPLKRLKPPIAAYFEPSDQEKIVNALGEYLPYEQRKMDGVDRLSRRLRL